MHGIPTIKKLNENIKTDEELRQYYANNKPTMRFSPARED